METYKEYVNDLLSRKEKEGKLPDLGLDTKRLMADMITEAFEIFRGVSQEEIVATLQGLREILVMLNQGKKR